MLVLKQMVMGILAILALAGLVAIVPLLASIVGILFVTTGWIFGAISTDEFLSESLFNALTVMVSLLALVGTLPLFGMLSDKLEAEESSRFRSGAVSEKTSKKIPILAAVTSTAADNQRVETVTVAQDANGGHSVNLLMPFASVAILALFAVPALFFNPIIAAFEQIAMLAIREGLLNAESYPLTASPPDNALPASLAVSTAAVTLLFGLHCLAKPARAARAADTHDTVTDGGPKYQCFIERYHLFSS